MLSPVDQLRLRVTAVSGDVVVTAEARSDLVVDRGGSAVTTADGVIEVRARRPHDTLELRCPEGADIIVGTRSGGVELRGRLGNVGVTSQSGSVVMAAAADADLRTVSGSVEVGTCAGRCRVSTTSGRIEIRAAGDAELSTVSAPVSVDDVAGAARVRSVSGNVTVTTAAHGPVHVRTVSGSITIRLPMGVRPSLKHSGRGRVRSSFEPGDDVVVEISNVSGSVQLLPA